MARVVSKESVRRANESMISGRGHGVSIDGSNMSIRCHTVVGNYTMVISRDTVLHEARKAFVKVVK